jgi:hypothetical protein
VGLPRRKWCSRFDLMMDNLSVEEAAQVKAFLSVGFGGTSRRFCMQIGQTLSQW